MSAKHTNIQNKPYEGKALQRPVSFSYQDKDGKEQTETIPPYIPAAELIRVVELMRILKRPLLIKGAPGSGKTRLCRAVAYELYGSDYRNYYFEWNVKSTSKAKDGLYAFDYLERLRDAQDKDKGALHPERYVRKGALGKAFEVSAAETPAIVLIDEIDKADIDFPNDLLLELDQLRYEIEEIAPDQEQKLERIQRAAYPPIIFITSNEEKELPPAFLRRCLFCYIEFPGKADLENIVQANFPYLKKEAVQSAVALFEELRNDMKKHPNTEKEVSTSELLDWMRAISHFFQEKVKTELEKLLQTAPEKRAEIETVLKALEEKSSLDETMMAKLDALLPDLSTALINRLENDPLSDLHPYLLVKSLNDFKIHILKDHA